MLQNCLLLLFVLPTVATATREVRQDTAVDCAPAGCSSEHHDTSSLLQRLGRGTSPLVDLLPTVLSACSVGEDVQCPASMVMCAGNQCCPGIEGGPTFPCPSASPLFDGCASPAKEEDCITSLPPASMPSRSPISAPTPAPPLFSACSVGDHVECPGSRAMCAGNQCCPGLNGGPSFPCPSASPSFDGCAVSIKAGDCLEAAAPTIVQSLAPTRAPMTAPTPPPTSFPMPASTEVSTEEPQRSPTPIPEEVISAAPIETPTLVPATSTTAPSSAVLPTPPPTLAPTEAPSVTTSAPTETPTPALTPAPTEAPSVPTQAPLLSLLAEQYQ
mmetsp:Transcript_114949/g.320210  ORF Transcript_114949/g.320210 Transcript_114949/m.320210 type:complete len:329 (+) Transcript_114949:69-1055(+)